MLRARAASASLCGTLAALVVACASKHADDAPKKWHVDAGEIKDASGRTVILRGANFAGAHKFPPHMSTFGADELHRLRDAFGFDVVRFLVTWAAVEPQKGVFDEAYLDELDQRMQWAKDAGVFVVIDMHQDLYGEGFPGGDGAPAWACDDARYKAYKPPAQWFFGYLDPNVEACVDAMYEPGGEPRAHFVAMWKHLAERLVKHDNVIGFDILNEPPWGSYTITEFESDKLAPFYVEVTNAVRAVAPDWLLFMEPAGSRNVGYPTSLPKMPFDNIVYAPHSYDNDSEQGKAFDPARADAIAQYLKALRSEADTFGAALFIGEYGGTSTNPGIAPYMRAEVSSASSVGAGSTYWAYDKDSKGYALLNDDGSEKKELADLVAVAYPTLVAGSGVTWAFDAGVATIRFTPDSSITEPTEIIAPTRAYPNGVDVDCGGCTVEQSPGRVLLRTAPPGSPAVVSLKPRP
jgi:endoglycosylceramidase